MCVGFLSYRKRGKLFCSVSPLDFGISDHSNQTNEERKKHISDEFHNHENHHIFELLEIIVVSR